MADIESTFGEKVAKTVAILTGEAAGNRKERTLKTYHKISQLTGGLSTVLIVEAADRSANLQACLDFNHHDKLLMYRQAHQSLNAAVYRKGLCDDIWMHIDKLILKL